MRTELDFRDHHVLADPATAAATLRERVYATITGLSTVAVLFGYAKGTSAWTAASSLAVTRRLMIIAIEIALGRPVIAIKTVAH